MDSPEPLLWRNVDQRGMDRHSCSLCWSSIQVQRTLFHCLFVLFFVVNALQNLWIISTNVYMSISCITISGVTLIESPSALEITMLKHPRTYSGEESQWVNSLSEFSDIRKLKRIVWSPQYDNNFINGDMALLQLEKKVTLNIQKAKTIPVSFLNLQIL